MLECVTHTQAKAWCPNCFGAGFACHCAAYFDSIIDTH